jgi:hypothetical protein
MTIRLAFRAFAAAVALTAAPAAACSVISSYRVPTNLELAERADTILLGTVEREEGSERSIGEVIVRPTLLLKGPVLPPVVRLRGYIPDKAVPATRSDPAELFRVNPDALSGGCNRYVFALGMQLVLFLERDDTGRLRPSLPPFARAAEDVPGPDALWVRAVRLYVGIAALPPKRRRAALIARREALRAAGDRNGALLAADIDRQLGTKRLAPFD